jgi:Cupin
MAERLVSLLIRPSACSTVPMSLLFVREIGVDVLSDVLRVVRLSGAIFFDVEARAPWVATTPEAVSIGGKVMPQSEHVIMFHAIRRARVAVRPSRPARRHGAGSHAWSAGR